MSASPRISRQVAERAVAALFELWSLDRSTCHAVGSFRRQRPEVGDLELLAPLPAAGERDALYYTIAGTMHPATDDLFSTADAAPEGRKWGRVIRGLKPGFLAAFLEVNMRPVGGERVALPVQVYRYAPENFGWLMIMYTGPKEFGQWFLGCWKKKQGIPIGDAAHPASIENHLVDVDKRRVAVRSEELAFGMAGLRYIHPGDRDAHMRRMKEMREGVRP